MNAKELFETRGAIYCKNVLSQDLAYFLTHALLRKSSIDSTSDDQVVGSLAVIDHELFLETAHEMIWPMLEGLLGEELLPTYAYSRLYTNGNVLEKHVDRPACEISVTVQLGRSHNYAWPIWAGNQRFDLAEGDGVIYKGCEVPHWRDACDGPAGYYSGQVFFHFVRALGPNAQHAFDAVQVRKKVIDDLYVRNRIHLMINK